jgi:ligand-binding sensor domain-containing protein
MNITRFILLLSLCLLPLAAHAIEPSISFERYTNDQGLSQNVTHNIAQDSQGFMWFATRDGLNRFKLNAKLNHGQWHEQTKTFNIETLPPPWWTWWAKTLYLLMMLAMLGLLAFVRLERQKRLNERTKALELNCVVIDTGIGMNEEQQSKSRRPKQQV